MTRKKTPTPTTASKSVPEQASEGLATIGELYLKQRDPSSAIDAFAAAGAIERLEPIAKDCLLSGHVPEALKAYRLAGIDPPRDLLVAAAERLTHTDMRLARTVKNDEALIEVYVALEDVTRLVQMGDVFLGRREYQLAAKAYAGSRITNLSRRLLENITFHIYGLDFNDASSALNAFPGVICPEEFIAFGDKMRDDWRYPAALWCYSMGREDGTRTANERLFALGCTLLGDDEYALACYAFDAALRSPPHDLLVAYVLRMLAEQQADAALEVYDRIADDLAPATHAAIGDALVECGCVRRAIDAYGRGNRAIDGWPLVRICDRLLLNREFAHLASILREEDTGSITPGWLVCLGDALLEQGQPDVAELAYEKAGAPLRAEEYLFYGQRMLARGNLDGAKALFLAARERASRT